MVDVGTTGEQQAHDVLVALASGSVEGDDARASARLTSSAPYSSSGPQVGSGVGSGRAPSQRQSRARYRRPSTEESGKERGGVAAAAGVSPGSSNCTVEAGGPRGGAARKVEAVAVQVEAEGSQKQLRRTGAAAPYPLQGEVSGVLKGAVGRSNAC